MKNIILLLIAFVIFVYKSQCQTVTDWDGNIYNTITIGAQIWMKENLQATHYSNGDVIGTTTLPVDNDSTIKYQWSYNDDTLNVTTYGRLYSWNVVTDNRNVCPAGWHVPGDTEWISLSNFLGGDSVAGNKMKETGTTHWLSTDSSVNNSSGFTGLPGGFRGNPNGFINLGSHGMYWSSTPWGSNAFPRAKIFILKSTNSSLEESVAVTNCGLSVRCISDLPASSENLFFEDRIHIFPNPATDKITVTCDATGNLNISIYNILGNLVFEKELRNKKNVIDLNLLTKGIYIIRINSGDNTLKRILIKE